MFRTLQICFFVSLITISSTQQCTSSHITNAKGLRPDCQPRPTTIQIQDPGDFQKGTIMTPDQIIVNKCSGSCQEGNVFHSCVSARTEKKTIKAYKRPFGYADSDAVCINHEIEEDLSCQCGCRISQSNCLESQSFNQDKCICQCNDEEARNRCFSEAHAQGISKVWNESNCQCRCETQYKECSTGFIYDSINTCSCVAQYASRSSHSAIVILIVALVVSVSAIGFLYFRYRKIRIALAKATFSRHQSVVKTADENKHLATEDTENRA